MNAIVSRDQFQPIQISAGLKRLTVDDFSLLFTAKSNGKVRVSIDQSLLNKALHRSHYPLWRVAPSHYLSDTMGPTLLIRNALWNKPCAWTLPGKTRSKRARTVCIDRIADNLLITGQTDAKDEADNKQLLDEVFVIPRIIKIEVGLSAKTSGSLRSH